MSEWRKENIATMALTVALVLGLYALGAGGWSALGGLLMLNLNFVDSTK